VRPDGEGARPRAPWAWRRGLPNGLGGSPGAVTMNEYLVLSAGARAEP